MRKIIIVCSIFLIAVFLLSFTPTAAACTPIDPDYWYIGIVEVLDSELPKGITVTAEKFPYRYLPDDLPGFNVRNDSGQPIHVLYGQTLRTLAAQGLSQNGTTIPDYLVEAGISMRAGGRSRRLVIVNDNLDETFDPLQVFSNPGFKDLNVRADERDGEVPDPQELDLGLEVEGKLYIVPIVVSYEFNPDYYPYRYRDSSEECAEFSATEEAMYAPTASASLQQANVDDMSDDIIIETEAASEVVEENNNPSTVKVIVSGAVLGLLFVIIFMVRIFGINKSVEFQEELDDD